MMPHAAIPVPETELEFTYHLLRGLVTMLSYCNMTVAQKEKFTIIWVAYSQF